MTRNNWSDLAKLLLSPALLTALGIILIVNPDGAVALVTKVIAWVLVIAALALVVSSLGENGSRRGGSLVGGAVCLLAGIWLMTHPLAIAQGLGRLLGIVLILEAAGDLVALGRGARSARKSGLVLALITLAAGITLVAVPMTLSQVVIVICGIVLLIIGVTGIVSRLRSYRYLSAGEDPDIIDVEKL